MFGGPPEGYQPSPLEQDLATRWRPSQAQIDAAAEDAAGFGWRDQVRYTPHLLFGKRYAIWSEDVAVLPIAGVFADRDLCSEAVKAAAKDVHERTGMPVTGGYTVHYPDGGWSVFEDILAVFPWTVAEGG